MKVLSKVVLGLLTFHAASANAHSSQDTSQSPNPSRAPEGLIPYEIVITPTISRTGLRELIEDVEEDFYEQFNELNIDDDYDIVCYKNTPLGTHIWRRTCEPIFMYKMRGEMAGMVTFLLSGAGVSFGGDDKKASAVGFARTDLQLTKERKREYSRLQELMVEYVEQDTTLAEIGSVLGQLKHRLENYENTN